MRALLVKEWRQLQPFGLGVVLAAWFSWWAAWDDPELFIVPSRGLEALLWIVPVLVGVGIGFYQLAVERTGGTLGLLVHRPVMVGRLVMAKVGAAWALWVLSCPLPIAVAWIVARAEADGLQLEPLRPFELAMTSTAALAAHALGMLAATLKVRPRNQGGFAVLLAVGLVVVGLIGWSPAWGEPVVRPLAFAGFHVAVALVVLLVVPGSLPRGGDRDRALPAGRVAAVGALGLIFLALPVWVLIALAEGMLGVRALENRPTLAARGDRIVLPAPDGDQTLCELAPPVREGTWMAGTGWTWTRAGASPDGSLLDSTPSWHVGSRWRAFNTHFGWNRHWLYLDLDVGELHLILRKGELVLRLVASKDDGSGFGSRLRPVFGFTRVSGSAWCLVDPLDDSLWEVRRQGLEASVRKVELPRGDRLAYILPSVPADFSPMRASGRTDPADIARLLVGENGAYTWDGQSIVEAQPDWIATVTNEPSEDPPISVRTSGDPLRPLVEVTDPGTGEVLATMRGGPRSVVGWLCWAGAQLTTLARPPASVLAGLLAEPERTTLHSATVAPLVVGRGRLDLAAAALVLGAWLAWRTQARLRRREAPIALTLAWTVIVLVTGLVGHAVFRIVEPESEPRADELGGVRRDVRVAARPLIAGDEA